MAVTIKINPCPSGTIDVEKSDGDLIATVTVAAGGTDAYQVADSAVTVNAAAFANVKATESQEVPVQYPDNTATGTISSGVVRIANNRFNIASAWKTGQTTSYAANDDGARQEGAGVDFFTLSENNPFGNTNRFTDTLGGQTYTNNIVIDWSQADYVGKTVLCWFRINQSAATWATVMAAQPLTFAAFANWFIPNYFQLSSIVRFNGDGLNYAPFSITVALWTSTTTNTNTAQAYGYGLGALVVGNLGNKTNAQPYICCRVFTFAELGITNY
jgi:hypothetical protein